MNHRVGLTISGLIFVVSCAILSQPAVAGKQYLWVTNAYGNDVHIIDVATHKVTDRIEVGPQPHGIAAPDDASVVFIAIEDFKGKVGELLWVDPRTHKVSHRLPVGPRPNQIACTPDGRWVYVPCRDEHAYQPVLRIEYRPIGPLCATPTRPN